MLHFLPVLHIENHASFPTDSDVLSIGNTSLSKYQEPIHSRKDAFIFIDFFYIYGKGRLKDFTVNAPACTKNLAPEYRTEKQIGNCSSVFHPRMRIILVNVSKLINE